MALREKGPHAGLSNDQLDAAYADVYQSYATATGLNKSTWAAALMPLQTEIIERLMNPVSFVLGYFGITKFPKYDAIQAQDSSLIGFRQAVAAQEAVKQNADEAVGDIASGIGFGLGGGVIIGLAALALVIAVKLK